MTAADHPAAPPHGSRPGDRQLALLRHAVAALADHARRGVAWPASPLVLVTAEPVPWRRFLGDLRESSADAAGIVVWDGRELGVEMAAAGERLHRLRDRLIAGPLLVVAGLERLGGRAAERRFAALLDAAAVAGTSVCLTTAVHPAGATFIPPLASRLCAGLVVPLPTVTVRQPDDPAARSAPRPSVATVIRTTARHLGVAASHLIGQGRCRSVVQARSLAMYLSRQLTGRSLGDIGKSLGGRDHSTVIHGVRSAAARLLEDPGLARDAGTITAELLGHPRRRSLRGGRRSG